MKKGVYFYFPYKFIFSLKRYYTVINQKELLANTRINSRQDGTKYAVGQVTFKGFAEGNIQGLSPSDQESVLQACRVQAVNKIMQDVYGEILVKLTAMKLFNDAVAQPQLHEALVELINDLEITD